MKYNFLLFGAVLGCSAVPAHPHMRDLSWSGDTLVATGNLIRSLDSGASGSVIIRPGSIRADGDAIVVTDLGEDRVLVLDSTGTVIRRIGARGRGPGELLGASHVAILQRSVFVGEANNGRISEFTLQGEYVGSLTSGFAAGSIAADNTYVYAAARSPDHYAVRIAASDLAQPALPRPTLQDDAANRWPRLPGHDLIAIAADRIWVFDQGRGFMCAYTSADSQAACYTLPSELRVRLASYRYDRVSELERAIRMRVEAAPLAKDLISAGPFLALLLPFPDMPVALVNPADGTLTPVITMDSADWIRTARSFAWDGRGFLLAGDDGLGRLLISNQYSQLRRP